MMTTFSKRINTSPFSYESMVVGSLAERAEAALSFIKPGSSCGLSLGSTYKAIVPHWITPLHNKGVRFFPVDERLVPLHHPDSNWGTLQTLLFEPLGDTIAMSHCAVSRHQYTTLLTTHFGEALPRFDVVFLGLGSDGHTASLFPGACYPDTTAVLATSSASHPHPRLSLSPGVLLHASELVLVVAGKDKQVAWQRLLSGDPDLVLSRILRARSCSRIIIDKEVV